MKSSYALLGALLIVILLSGCALPWQPAPASTLPPSLPPTSTELAQAPTALPTVATATQPVPAATQPAPTAAPTAGPTAVATLPPPTGTASPEEAAVLKTMDQIGSEMQSVRGLDATRPVTETMMSRQELADYMQADFDRENTPEQVQADTRAMAAFDFIPEDYDLRKELLALYSEQIVGFYDEDTKALYVVSDTGLDLMGRITMAHEYTHGLQDEHFNLKALVDDKRYDDDAVLAHRALAEGDASLAEVQYLMAHLSDLTAEDLQNLQAAAEQAQPTLESAPPIISATLMFPYIYGQPFVQALQQNGWEAVDAAYAKPPASTEQILHVDKYLAGDEPQIVSLPPLTGTLGTGWHLADDSVLGEFQTRLYLEQRVPAATAEQAAAGWDGDRYAVYFNGSDEMLAFRTVWDTAGDRQQFVDAYAAYAQAKYGEKGTASGNGLTWDTTSQAASVTWGDTTALIILAPDQAIVDKVLAAVGP